MLNFLPNVFFCEKKECLKKKWKRRPCLALLSFKRQEKENEKRIFSTFSFFYFLEEKKEGPDAAEKEGF